MELVEVVRALAIAATAVVTCAAAEALLAVRWLSRHAGAPPGRDGPSLDRG